MAEASRNPSRQELATLQPGICAAILEGSPPGEEGAPASAGGGDQDHEPQIHPARVPGAGFDVCLNWCA